MKVKIFRSETESNLEEQINNFLSDFAEIENVKFTTLKGINRFTILCSYEGETWEEHNIKMENALAAADALESHYDQTIGSYQ